MKKIVIIGIILIAGINGVAQTYDPEKAAEYANFWCDKINNDPYSPYYDKEKWGGPYNYWPGIDCANFVSQCLKCGGLNLSIGINPNLTPPNNGVDGKGCMDNASNLVKHLANWQNTSIYVSSSGFTPPTDHDKGDPMFIAKGDTGISASHSMFCSSLDWDARRLYNAHSTDTCNAYWPSKLKKGRLIFFHIKSSIPDHCFNCKQDADKGEEGIDCGGPCPPCEHAPDRVIIDSPTENLPSNVNAIEEISAGNAAVKVLSGQNVNFKTAGTIRLLPGFEAKSGSNFNAQVKGSILGVTADCNDFCWPHFYYNQYLRWVQTYELYDFANIEKVYYEVRLRNAYGNGGKFVYSETVDVTQEGIVELWDLVTGKNLKGHFKHGDYWDYIIYIKLFPCQGGSYWIPYGHLIRVWNLDEWWFKNKSSSMDLKFNETENPDTFLSPPANSITLQDENATPNFVIIPNPNSGAFQIEPNFPLSDIVNLKITNLSGALIYETQTLSSNTIQLPASASGQHVVIVTLKAGAVLTQKMMLQR